MELKGRTVLFLIDSIFFDTDCISAFLWVKNESLLETMYSGKIVIPKEVYDELNKPSILHLKHRIDQLISRGSAKIMTMYIMTEEYDLYRNLTTISEYNHKVIGKGEAASISLAKKYNGILGSNNLRDIKYYVDKFSLKHITTGDILVKAYEDNLITEDQGNIIWSEMLSKRRRIGADSFTEFLKIKKSYDN